MLFNGYYILSGSVYESTGFPTWHRQFLLWFEWEVQYMLKELNGTEDYYRFRIPYWDWRKEKQTKANSPFQKNRLGETRDNHGLPQVYGGIFNDWETICWKNDNNICDPTTPTGQLQRCPFVNGSNPCSSDNDLWPSVDEVKEVLSLQAYDTSDFNINASNSFRNQL